MLLSAEEGRVFSEFISLEKIGRNCLLVNRRTGCWLIVNQVAGHMLSLLLKNRNNPEVVISEVSRRYKTPREVIRKDFGDLLAGVRERGLVALEDKKKTLVTPKLEKAYFEVTTRCNLKCPFCYNPREKYPCEELSTTQVFQIIDRLKGLGVTTLSLSGGEPFMRSDIKEVLMYVANAGFKNKSVITNLTILDEDAVGILSKNNYMVQISLDAGTKGLYEKMRKGSRFSTLKRNLSLLLREVPAGNITLAFVPMKQNYRHFRDFVEFARRQGIRNLSIPQLRRLGRARNVWGKVSLSKRETVDFYEDVSTVKKDFPDIKISMDGYKSFKEVEKFGNSGISNCPLGENIRINPFGWVYACLVIDDDGWTLGNILDADFNTAGNKVLSRLQDVSLNRFDENIECQKCVWYPFCRGGCMADAYLLNGDFNSADSLCTLKKSVLKKLFREQADN